MLLLKNFGLHSNIIPLLILILSSLSSKKNDFWTPYCIFNFSNTCAYLSMELIYGNKNIESNGFKSKRCNKFNSYNRTFMFNLFI